MYTMQRTSMGTCIHILLVKLLILNKISVKAYFNNDMNEKHESQL